VAWLDTRQGVMAELQVIPVERFAEVPPGLMRSPLDIANHIIESGRLMSGELSRPDGDFSRASYAEITAGYSLEGDVAGDMATALEALRRSHADGERQLREAGEQFLLTPIRQFNGVEAPRLSWLHHGIAHEEYHRGQLALYARLLGVVPALTRQILGTG
jgi:uncharacterized damage-inducible protein DinB